MDYLCPVYASLIALPVRSNSMKTLSGVLAISNTKPATAKARILVVDNDSQIRRLMRTTLSAQGFGKVGEALLGPYCRIFRSG